MKVADGAFVDEGSDVIEIGMKVALGAALSGELTLILQVGFPDHAGFLHRVGQRLFPVNVQSTVHRPNGNKSVVMVWGAADHRVEIFLVQTLAPILVSFGFRKILAGGSQSVGIDVAERYHVFLFQHRKVSGSPSPAAN